MTTTEAQEIVSKIYDLSVEAVKLEGLLLKARDSYLLRSPVNKGMLEVAVKLEQASDILDDAAEELQKFQHILGEPSL